MTQRLRRKEAAHYIGISARTLEKLAVTGMGPPYYKIGGIVLYEIAEIDAWMSSFRRTSTSDVGVKNADNETKRHSAYTRA